MSLQVKFAAQRPTTPLRKRSLPAKLLFPEMKGGKKRWAATAAALGAGALATAFLAPEAVTSKAAPVLNQVSNFLAPKIQPAVDATSARLTEAAATAGFALPALKSETVAQAAPLATAGGFTILGLSRLAGNSGVKALKNKQLLQNTQAFMKKEGLTTSQLVEATNELVKAEPKAELSPKVAALKAFVNIQAGNPKKPAVAKQALKAFAKVVNHKKFARNLELANKPEPAKAPRRSRAASILPTQGTQLAYQA